MLQDASLPAYYKNSYKYTFSSIFSSAIIFSIAIRNVEILWKLRWNRPFFFFNLEFQNLLEPNQSWSACIINNRTEGNLVKVKGLSTYFVLTLRMPGENFSICYCYSSRTATGISFFTITTTNDD